MKTHPDVTIAFRAPAKDYDEGHQAMLRQAVTNQLPDIYFPGFHLLPELAARAGEARPDRRRRPAARGRARAVAARRTTPTR